MLYHNTAVILSILTTLIIAEPSASAQSAGDTFRVDYGSPGFMNAEIPAQGGSKMSELEKFKARMEAARSNVKRSGWADDFEEVCSTDVDFEAEIYPLNIDAPDPGWAWVADELDRCFQGPYPGGFSPYDEGYQVLRVEFESLPEKVRTWVREHPSATLAREGAGPSVEQVEEPSVDDSFCVIDGIAFFPPAWFIERMPLFAAQEDCGGVFASLDKYGKEVDGERVSGALKGRAEVGNTIHVSATVSLSKRKVKTRDEL